MIKRIVIVLIAFLLGIVGVWAYTYHTMPCETVTMRVHYVNGRSETVSIRVKQGTKFRVNTHYGSYRLIGIRMNINQVGIPGVLSYEILK